MDLFTCKTCGSHDLTVEHVYTVIETSTLLLACTCGYTADDIAATSIRAWATPMREWGPLDEDHHWDYEDKEEGDPEELDGNITIFCPHCFELDANDETAWELVSTEASIDEGIDNEFFVFCASCDREIEFGWSHPDRYGRIWPAECTDFNPWKSWPEPRYHDAWAKKGWLRPGT